VTSWHAKGALLLAGAFCVGLASGAVVQRVVGFGSILRSVGLGSGVAESPAPAREPFEVPLAHRGRMLLFVLAGQSNMVGWAELPPEEERRRDPRIYVFGNDYRWRPGLEPVDDARAQVDRVSEDRAAGFGPSMAFALESVARRPDTVLGLIPCAKGASSIEEWQRSLSDQTLYGSCLKRIRAAEPMGEVAGVLFFQGEADALEPTQARVPLHAADWAEWFTRLVSSLREDLGDAELPVVFAQIGTTTHGEAFTAWESVKAQQASVALRRVSMIRTDDLDTFDGLHFTAESYRTIGQRFAEAYRALAAQER
jgi:hypothetical protein